MRISLEKALSLIEESVMPLAPETVPLDKALGRILASSVSAGMDQPPFPRSPYDGYALRAGDTAGADENSPAVLEITGRSFAGAPAGVSVGAGQAVRIMTGGVIPEGADCVAMQEKTEAYKDRLKVFTELSPYDNYCRQGEDFHAGDILVSAGTRVTAAVCAVAASAGVTELKVFPRPLTALIPTGDELQTPGTALAPGRIYDSNAAYLSARLCELGIPQTAAVPVADDLDAIAAVVEKASRSCALAVTTGGVSVGEKDYLPDVFKKLGAETVFHGVDMKPGMPAALAVLNGTPILALSGNPFACAVTFELLGRSALAKLSSDPSLAPEKTRGVLVKTWEKRRPCRRFLRAVCENGVVSFPPEQQNGQMRSMIGCNCLAELPAGEGTLPSGTQVEVFML